MIRAVSNTQGFMAVAAGRVNSVLGRACRLLVSLLMVNVLVAHADEQDVFNLVAGTGFTYDDNLFRLPSSATLPAHLGKSKSDRITNAYGGFQGGKPIAV